MAAEAFGSLSMKAKVTGIIKGFVSGCNKDVITYLQFADDTMLFSLIAR